MAFEDLNESLGQHQRDLKIPIMKTKQSAKQLHLFGNQFCGNAEHMAEYEILGGVVAHMIRGRLALGIKECIEQAPVELFNDRVAQVGEYLSEVK